MKVEFFFWVDRPELIEYLYIHTYKFNKTTSNKRKIKSTYFISQKHQNLINFILTIKNWY